MCIYNKCRIRTIYQFNGKVFQNVMLYMYVIGEKMTMERSDFKKNMKNLNFISLELRHWQAICQNPALFTGREIRI